MARNLARTWLGLIAVSNIVLTPVLAFSVTYLIEVESSAQGIAFNLRPDLIPFILSASLAYGAMALVLALGSGAYVPIWVVDRGGWRAVGLTSDVRGAARVRHARHRYQRSLTGRWSNSFAIVTKGAKDSLRFTVACSCSPSRCS